MSAADSFFVDTNILLYSINATEPGKQGLARQWADVVWRAKTWLLSEDFQAGQKFDLVTVVNPFECRPDDFGLA